MLSRQTGSVWAESRTIVQSESRGFSYASRNPPSGSVVNIDGPQYDLGDAAKILGILVGIARGEGMRTTRLIQNKA
jgi:hypothetical protein